MRSSSRSLDVLASLKNKKKYIGKIGTNFPNRIDPNFRAG